MLPKDLDLDGELYLRRNGFSETSSVVRSHASGRWNELVFKVSRSISDLSSLETFFDDPFSSLQVFDIPSSTLTFEDRLALLHARFGAPTGTLLDGGENRHYGHPEGRRDKVIEVLGHVKCESK